MFQSSIPKDEQSESLTRIATTAKKFIVRSDEQLTAFLELDRITNELAVSALLADGE